MSGSAPWLPPELPFPTRETVVHEVGHMVMVCLLTANFDGLSFFARDRGDAGGVSHRRSGVSLTDQLAIAVAGVVAQHAAGDSGYLGQQLTPGDALVRDLSEANWHFRGDWGNVRAISKHLPSNVPFETVMEAAFTRVREVFVSLGGIDFLTALADRILEWLESDNRASWRKALSPDTDSEFVCLWAKDLRELLHALAQEKPMFAEGCQALLTSPALRPKDKA